MRPFDREGLALASFQGRLFAESLRQTDTSSPIFLRRFFLSDFAFSLDEKPAPLVDLDIPRAFEDIEKQYGKSTYGKERYHERGLYWLGYFARYVCYTREISSRDFYHLFDVKKLYGLYEAYHTQSEEWVLSHLLKSNGYTEDVFDVNERIKNAIRRHMQNKDSSVVIEG